MEPIGNHQFHGFSPALDLQQVSRTALGSGFPGGEGPLNILLLQPGDSRSIIKTVAQRFRHSSRPLHFYVYERPLEGIARHLLLLAIALDWDLALRTRAATWLEVYGNALIQTRTARYVSALRTGLIEVVCGGSGTGASSSGGDGGATPLSALASLVDVSTLLRHKQRDELEEVLKAWDERAGYDMNLYRDTRVRHHHGVRYDARTNLADWDYQTVIKPASGSIHWKQYRDWRASGVAFEFGDQVYEAPNRTMASFVEGRERRRGSILCRGFWGDIIVSPFHALGTSAYVPTDDEAAAAQLAASMREEVGGGASSCSDSKKSGGSSGNHACDLFDITNRRTGSEQWRHHACEIATYNVLSWLHECETGCTYVLRKPHDVHSGLILHAEAGKGEEGGSGEASSAVAMEGKAEAAAPPLARAKGEGEGGEGGEGDSTETGPAEVAAVAMPPPPPPALTPQEAARVVADVKAAAASRARSMARAFRNVRVTFMGGGDFVADYAAKGKLNSLFHVVTLSGRSVHHLAHADFARIISPQGSILIAETARNIPSLSSEQRAEYTRRVIGMGARMGAVLLGSDRNMSADTFSIGSVVEHVTSSPPGGDGATAASKAKAGAASDVRCFESPSTGELDGLPPPLPSTTFNGVSPLALPPAAAGSSAPRRPLNVKAMGMEPFSSTPHALPPAAALLRAAKEGGEEALAAAAGVAAADAAAYMRGVAAHDVRGGDNPAPEALVFAILPSPITAAVARAYATLEARAAKAGETIAAALQAPAEPPPAAE